MAIQFAPLPQFKAQSLVPEIKVQPVARQSVPVASPYSKKREDREATKDMMLAMALATVAPSATEGILSLFEKTPVGKKLLTKTEAAKPGPTQADYEAMRAQLRAGGLEEPEIDRIIEAEKVTEAVFPSGRPERQVPSGLRKTLSALGNLAPAAALKTSAGMGVFGELYQDNLERLAAPSIAEAEMAAEKAKQRNILQKNLVEKEAFDRERKIYYGWDPVENKEKRREGVRSGRFIYLRSQGDETFDLDINGKAVPRGQLYINPITSSSLDDKADEVKNFGTYQSKKNPQKIYRGYSQITRGGPDEGRVFKEFIQTPEGLVENDGSWLEINNVDADMESLKKLYEDSTEDIAEFYKELTKIKGGVVSAGNLLVDTATRLENSATGTTTYGALLDFANNIRANVQAYNAAGYPQPKEVLSSLPGADVRLMLQLEKALSAYQDNPTDPNVRENLEKTFDRVATQINNLETTSTFGPTRNIPLLSEGFGKGLFQGAAEERAIILASQLQLAYRAAASAGQTGRTLSDKDLAFFLQIVGYGQSQDPEVIAKQLYSFGNVLINDYNLGMADNEIASKAADLRKPGAMEREVSIIYDVSPDDLETAKNPGPNQKAVQQNILDEIYKRSSGFSGSHLGWRPNDDGTATLVLKTFEETELFNDFFEETTGLAGDFVPRVEAYRKTLGTGSSRRKPQVNKDEALQQLILQPDSP